jgi:WD40 repeat protein
VAEFHVAVDDAKSCCFSPDGRLVAAAAGNTAYVWDITSPDPTLLGPLLAILETSPPLYFPPLPLISSSKDQSVKFWQIGVLSADPVIADQQPSLLHLA